MMKRSFDASADSIRNVSSKVKDINEKLDTTKFPWMTIILLASSVLIPMFWDKIKSFLSKIDNMLNITKLVDKLVNMVDWDKYINMVVDRVKDIVLEKLGKWVTDPCQAILDSLVWLWNKLCGWKDSIEQWAFERTQSTIDIIDKEDRQN